MLWKLTTHSKSPCRHSLCAVAAVTLSMIVTAAAAGLPAAPLMSQPGVSTSDKPQSEKVLLNTKDGVRIVAVYFPAFIKTDRSKTPNPDVGKGIAPVILIHDWNGRASELFSLASYLQKSKMSVLAIDLRGHGDSKTQVVAGQEIKIDRKRIKNSFMQTAVYDIEAGKVFLKKKNNNKQVNIEMLTVIGTGAGAALALNWSAMDWNAKPLPNRKQGQDVKALILLSPKLTYKGINARAALGHPAMRNFISVQTISGARSSSNKDADKIYDTLHNSKNEESKTRVVNIELDTNLEGPRILTSPLGHSTAEHMEKFINARVFKFADKFQWADRTPPENN